jgi:dephospho-CoA kinase
MESYCRNDYPSYFNHNMKVLVFGPSGSGKTYISRALKKSGVNAFDAEEIENLSAWFDKNGKKISDPQTAGEAAGAAFVWDKRALKKFLNKFSEVYVFGGSGNVFNVFDLFDKVYFLKIDPQLQKERILNASDRNHNMDFNKNEIIIWGDWFEEEARKRSIPFIDGSKTAQEIFEIISMKQ